MRPTHRGAGMRRSWRAWPWLLWYFAAEGAWALDGRCGGGLDPLEALLKSAWPGLVVGVVGGLACALLWALLVWLLRRLSKGRRCKSRPRLLRVGIIAGAVCFVLVWLFVWQLSKLCF